MYRRQYLYLLGTAQHTDLQSREKPRSQANIRRLGVPRNLTQMGGSSRRCFGLLR